MLSHRDDIIKKLKLEINTLKGFKPIRNSRLDSPVLGPITKAFPGEFFPLGCLHELYCQDASDRSACIGFISVVLSSYLHKGVVIWISRKDRVFSPALHKFYIDPSQIIFIRPENQKDLLWTIEESLKCRPLSAVVCELPEMDFNVSRRFQLAVEGSRVTTFIIREGVKIKSNTASPAKWRVTHIPSETHDLPGIGFVSWKVQLEKFKNGKACNWELFYKNGKLMEFINQEEQQLELDRKTG